MHPTPEQIERMRRSHAELRWERRHPHSYSLADRRRARAERRALNAMAHRLRIGGRTQGEPR
jgi:hypothetical protein